MQNWVSPVAWSICQQKTRLSLIVVGISSAESGGTESGTATTIAQGGATVAGFSALTLDAGLSFELEGTKRNHRQLYGSGLGYAPYLPSIIGQMGSSLLLMKPGNH